ncbi:MAG: chromosomal replication initiator protein DnaA [Lentisphaeria bacterium]|nr:chromosomal replication initiator protein DnaA [Lentisphaeria bacterium]
MATVSELWQAARRQLQDVVNEDTFARWIAGIVPVRMEDSRVILGVSYDVFADWLTLNYQSVIEKAVRDAAGSGGGHLSVVFESGHEPPAGADAGPALPRRAVAPRPAVAEAAGVNPRLLNRRFSFLTFVVGDNNRFAHAACLAVSHAPGTVYNPLFIHSPTGLGKTHLLQATAQELLSRVPHSRVELTSSEEFSNAYIEALKGNALGQFRGHYRNVDLLLIDDVHFFTGKERFQEEFFHTFNALYHGHKQIVLTSDRPPHEIGGLEKRLVSRFEWGLTTDIGQPDIETRIAILKKKQDDHAVKLRDDVLLLIAGRIKSNIRRLEGALIRLVSFASVTGVELDPARAERVLGPVLDEEAGCQISIEQIQRTVAEYYDIRLADMTSKRRPQNIAAPRQVAMYLCRKLTDFSSPVIGEQFSRNHATVLHAEQTVQERMGRDAEFRREVTSLVRRIRA